MSIQTTTKSKVGGIVEVNGQIATVRAIEDKETITVQFRKTEETRVVTDSEITLL